MLLLTVLCLWPIVGASFIKEIDDRLFYQWKINSKATDELYFFLDRVIPNDFFDSTTVNSFSTNAIWNKIYDICSDVGGVVPTWNSFHGVQSAPEEYRNALKPGYTYMYKLTKQAVVTDISNGNEKDSEDIAKKTKANELSVVCKLNEGMLPELSLTLNLVNADVSSKQVKCTAQLKPPLRAEQALFLAITDPWTHLQLLDRFDPDSLLFTRFDPGDNDMSISQSAANHGRYLCAGFVVSGLQKKYNVVLRAKVVGGDFLEAPAPPAPIQAADVNDLRRRVAAVGNTGVQLADVLAEVIGKYGLSGSRLPTKEQRKMKREGREPAGNKFIITIALSATSLTIIIVLIVAGVLGVVCYVVSGYRLEKRQRNVKSAVPLTEHQRLTAISMQPTQIPDPSAKGSVKLARTQSLRDDALKSAKTNQKSAITNQKSIRSMQKSGRSIQKSAKVQMHSIPKTV